MQHSTIRSVQIRSFWNRNKKFHQANKVVTLLQKLETFLPCTSLLTIYKSFLRSLLNYADLIYEKESNASFSLKKIESVQCNAALTIIGVLKAPVMKKCTGS